MSLEMHLVMRCTIARAGVETLDSGEQKKQWNNVWATNVPCFVWQLSGKERAESALDTVISHRAIMEYGRDVTEKDRILNVVDAGGQTLITQADIDFVDHNPGGQRSHVELNLREVKTYD
mgnify:FL=1